MNREIIETNRYSLQKKDWKRFSFLPPGLWEQLLYLCLFQYRVSLVTRIPRVKQLGASNVGSSVDEQPCSEIQPQMAGASKLKLHNFLSTHTTFLSSHFYESRIRNNQYLILHFQYLFYFFTYTVKKNTVKNCYTLNSEIKFQQKFIWIQVKFIWI